VQVIDVLGSQHITDPDTGEELNPDSDPALIGIVTGVVWNGQHAALTKVGRKGLNSGSAMLEHFERVFECCPEGHHVIYETRSDWLLG
jgi:hypothetical protein